jgi:hypothetical protein
MIYTTNAIESLHMQLRKVLKTRGHFPSDEAVTKLIYLVLRDITKKWTNLAATWRTCSRHSRNPPGPGAILDRSGRQFVARPTETKRPKPLTKRKPAHTQKSRHYRLNFGSPASLV